MRERRDVNEITNPIFLGLGTVGHHDCATCRDVDVLRIHIDQLLEGHYYCCVLRSGIALNFISHDIRYRLEDKSGVRCGRILIFRLHRLRPVEDYFVKQYVITAGPFIPILDDSLCRNYLQTPRIGEMHHMFGELN